MTDDLIPCKVNSSPAIELRQPFHRHDHHAAPSKFNLSALKSNPYLYERALTEVLKLENEDAINSATSFIVKFEVKYRASWGQVVKVTGSSEPLGNWNVERGLELHWTPGDLWTGQAHIRDVAMNTIEFKYAVVADGRARWEQGYNRRAVLNDGAEKVDGKIVRTFRHEWRGRDPQARSEAS
jgi:hypothetical protein